MNAGFTDANGTFLHAKSFVPIPFVSCFVSNALQFTASLGRVIKFWVSRFLGYYGHRQS